MAVHQYKSQAMKTRRFNFPFSVADTERGPFIRWDAFNLIVEFTSHLKKDCSVRFEGVSHFELLSEDELDPNLFSYDEVTEVLDSPVIERLVLIGDIAAEEANGFTHLVIGFNAIKAYLVVVCRAIHDNHVDSPAKN